MIRSKQWRLGAVGVALSLAASCSGGDATTPGTRTGEVGTTFLATWGDLNDDVATALAFVPDGSGDVVVGALIANPAVPDMVVYRLGSDGTPRWEARWGRTAAEELHALVAFDDVVRVAGATWDRQDDDAEIEAILVDVQLDDGSVPEAFEPTFNWNASGERDAITGLLPFANGDVFASGVANDDVLLARIDVAGARTTSQLHDRFKREEGLDSDWLGDLAVVVGRNEDVNDEDDQGQFYVAAFDTETYLTEWELEWGLEDVEEVAYGVAVAGDVVVAVGQDGLDQAVVLGIEAGKVTWEYTYPADDQVAVASAAVTEPDGNVIVGINVSGDVVLLRLDPTTGAVLDEVTWDGRGTQAVHALEADEERLCVMGATDGGSDDKKQALATCFPRETLAIPAVPANP